MPRGLRKKLQGPADIEKKLGSVKSEQTMNCVKVINVPESGCSLVQHMLETPQNEPSIAHWVHTKQLLPKRIPAELLVSIESQRFHPFRKFLTYICAASSKNERYNQQDVQKGRHSTLNNCTNDRPLVDFTLFQHLILF